MYLNQTSKVLKSKWFLLIIKGKVVIDQQKFDKKFFNNFIKTKSLKPINIWNVLSYNYLIQGPAYTNKLYI